jgi:hypothetical protein
MRREENGDPWDNAMAVGLLHSLCFIPLLSYGSTAPLALLSGSQPDWNEWPETPFGRQRLQGAEEDHEDGVLKVVRAPHSFSITSSVQIPRTFSTSNQSSITVQRENYCHLLLHV